MDMQYRIEHDSMGEVKVPADRYWGAQTERSRGNFPIGVGIEIMPQEIIHALALIKKACALANRELVPEKMTEEKCAAIRTAAEEIMDGTLAAHFPLVVFQTGSGTQTNINVNEVIANRGNQLLVRFIRCDNLAHCLSPFWFWFRLVEERVRGEAKTLGLLAIIGQFTPKLIEQLPPLLI